MCDCFDLDCLCDNERPVPVHVGDTLTKTNGTQWKVIGTDRSGQGFIVRGPQGQTNCEPTNEDGTLMFPKHWKF